MEASLYGEGGFYQTRRPTEDFYTAPELHPAFGELLAAEVAARLRRTAEKAKGPLWVVEAGCGDGRLFRAVAAGLRGALPELFPDLMFGLVDRSTAALGSALEAEFQPRGRLVGCASLETLPAFSGVLYSNELIDALPFHLLEKRGGKVDEVVVKNGRPSLAPIEDSRLADAAAAVGPALDEGSRHAVCLDRAKWLALAASKLRVGFVVTVDYGRRYPAEAPVPVKTYKKHRLGDDPFQGGDITANVDFEAMIREGEAAGLKLESYETLSSFLMRLGVAERFERAAEYSERNKLKTLIHPEGMGEIFKVLIQSKGL
jgi:SAM-dependent MidA family methyltransferase